MLKKIVLLCVSLLISNILLFAQKGITESYIQQYKDLAISEMQRTGVPAAIKLAQAILESQSGRSKLATTANNHFGIKCKTEWTGNKTYQDDDERGECFRVYRSVEESYKDHSDFLRNRPYYTSLFSLNPSDLKGWAYGLKKAGYATNPSYPQRLLSIIEDYKLDQYFSSEVTSNKTPSPEIKPTIEYAKESKRELQAQNEIQYNWNSLFPRGIFLINRSKVIYALAGTNLSDLLKQYDISSEELLEFNDIANIEVLTENRLIFLEKKLKKGNKAFRITQTAESWKDISQLEGVQLEYLLRYNEVINSASIIPAGQKIRLQPFNDVNNKLIGSTSSSTPQK
ncbi:MAG: glucosaminidase domain-containing protein [Chitinophagia bacterium]|jgi:hypothetical protein